MFPLAIVTGTYRCNLPIVAVKYSREEIGSTRFSQSICALDVCVVLETVKYV